MLIREKACYGCPECIHCHLYGQWFEYCKCDSCDESAEYICDDVMYCKECFNEMLMEEWNKYTIKDKVAILQNSKFASDYAQWLSSGSELTEEEEEKILEWMYPDGYVEDCLVVEEFATLLDIDYELTEDQ